MDNLPLDRETTEIVSEQKKLQSLTGHEGWSIIHTKFTEKILSLQNAFDIEVGDAQKMLIDLQSRKIASALLFDFLREIEGTASQAEDNKEILQSSHIIRID